MGTCLGEEHSSPLGCFWLLGAMGKGMGRSVYGLAQLPIIKLSLTAA